MVSSIIPAPVPQLAGPFDMTEVRELTAEFVAQLEAHLNARIEAAVGRAAATARSAARRELAEELNQGLRRLRQCEDADAVLAVLLDASAPFASRAAVFTLEGQTVRGGRVRGLESIGRSFLRVGIPAGSGRRVRQRRGIAGSCDRGYSRFGNWIPKPGVVRSSGGRSRVSVPARPPSEYCGNPVCDRGHAAGGDRAPGASGRCRIYRARFSNAFREDRRSEVWRR